MEPMFHLLGHEECRDSKKYRTNKNFSIGLNDSITVYIYCTA